MFLGNKKYGNKTNLKKIYSLTTDLGGRFSWHCQRTGAINSNNGKLWLTVIKLVRVDKDKYNLQRKSTAHALQSIFNLADENSLRIFHCWSVVCGGYVSDEHCDSSYELQ